MGKRDCECCRVIVSFNNACLGCHVTLITLPNNTASTASADGSGRGGLAGELLVMILVVEYVGTSSHPITLAPGAFFNAE